MTCHDSRQLPHQLLCKARYLLFLKFAIFTAGWNFIQCATSLSPIAPSGSIPISSTGTFGFSRFALRSRSSGFGSSPGCGNFNYGVRNGATAFSLRSSFRSGEGSRWPLFLQPKPLGKEDITAARTDQNESTTLSGPNANPQPLEPGVPWGSYQDIDSLPYDSALRVLKAYHSIHGNLVIPRGFVVPSTKPYPKEWHGAKLSRHIYNMKWWQRHIGQFAQPPQQNNHHTQLTQQPHPTHIHRVTQLNQLGFLWERLQPEWNLFILALTSYLEIYGDVIVPQTFVIPQEGKECENWPKATWGYGLGSVVYRVRYRHDFLSGDNAMERRRQLELLGFIWDLGDYNFSKVYRALLHFDRLDKQTNPIQKDQSTIRVPSKFVIPSGQEAIRNGWPKDLWNYPLGAKCMAIRQKLLYIKDHPERKQALEDIGFRVSSGNATLGWLDVVHAAAIYSQMHGRVLNAPLDFCVPAPPCALSSDGQCDDSWPWPERLWGLKLGQRLKDVRLKGAYLKGPDANLRRAQLDNLGFVWNPKRGRRKRC